MDRTQVGQRLDMPPAYIAFSQLRTGIISVDGALMYVLAVLVLFQFLLRPTIAFADGSEENVLTISVSHSNTPNQDLVGWRNVHLPKGFEPSYYLEDQNHKYLYVGRVDGGQILQYLAHDNSKLIRKLVSGPQEPAGETVFTSALQIRRKFLVQVSNFITREFALGWDIKVFYIEPLGTLRFASRWYHLQRMSEEGNEGNQSFAFLSDAVADQSDSCIYMLQQPFLPPDSRAQNRIDVFKVGRSGSVTLLPSYGIYSPRSRSCNIAFDENHQLLYVSDESGFSTFQIHRRGQLTSIGHTNLINMLRSGVGQITAFALDPTDQLLFTGCSTSHLSIDTQVDVWRIRPGGGVQSLRRLNIPAPRPPFPAVESTSRDANPTTFIILHYNNADRTLKVRVESTAQGGAECEVIRTFHVIEDHVNPVPMQKSQDTN